MTSLYVLVRILRDKNRDKDFIYITLVILMLLYGIFQTPLDAVFLQDQMQKKDWLRIFLFFAWYTNFIVHWLFPMFFVETGIVILSLKNPKNAMLDSRDTVASCSPDGIQGQVHPFHNEKKNTNSSVTKAVRCI